jgi:hypothetical protein
MISDARVDRYYYIFDSRTHQALVLDRTTGRERARDAGPRAQLIEHVQAQRSSALLRQFARWCARQVEANELPSHTAAGRLWAAARRSDPSAWERVRRETADAVMLAVALGLPHSQPDAAQLLTLQACTHADAPRAALDAAHMSERWAEFCAPSDPEAAARVMRTRHVDWLLDSM